jgi:hypothetical protein
LDRLSQRHLFCPGRRASIYFDFATRQAHLIFELDKEFSSGLSVSPDGRRILYSQEGDTTGDIMLVDHFR